MGCGNRLAVFSALCTGILGFSFSAAAQEGPYDAKGLPLGGFRLFPTLDLGANYDDNVYRTQNSAKSDYYFLENPGFILKSQWSRHELDLFGALNAYQYASLDSENHNDWNIGGNGRLDILRGTYFAGGGSYAVQHESRTSPDQSGYAKEPTQFALARADAALEYRPYHFGFSLGGNYTRYDYDPTKLIGSTSIDNTDRNRDEYIAYAKSSYEFSPGYAMFVQVNYKDVRYDLDLDRSGLQRANDGYSVNAGLDMLVTNLVKGQIFAGYLSQRYHTPLVNVSGLNYGANVDWSASEIWTFHLTASRALNGTTISTASAQDERAVRLGVDYSVLQNVMVQAHIGYTDSVFSGSTRDDKYTDAGIGVEYDLNQNISAKLAYTFRNRDSTIAGQDFNENQATVGLSFRL